MLNRHNTRAVWRTCSPGTGRATLRVRAAAPAGETADVFTDYTLFHVGKETAELNDEQTAELDLAGTEAAFFTVWQDDLDNAGAPRPRNGSLIVWQGGTYLIVRVAKTLFENEHGCLCQRVMP